MKEPSPRFDLGMNILVSRGMKVTKTLYRFIHQCLQRRAASACRRKIRT